MVLKLVSGQKKIISQLILDKYGISISESTCGRFLHEKNLSVQKPIRKSYKQNKEQVKDWKENIYPEIMESSGEDNSQVIFLDESTVKSDHSSGTTWGESGITPIVPAIGYPVKVNIIGSVDHDGNSDFLSFNCSIDGEIFCIYLKHLLGKSENKMHIICDNASFHRSSKVKTFLELNKERLKVSYLPPYSPELNPVELIWAHIKHHGMNKYVIKNNEDLNTKISEHLTYLMNNPKFCLRLLGKKELEYIIETKIKLAA